MKKTILRRYARLIAEKGMLERLQIRYPYTREQAIDISIRENLMPILHIYPTAA